MSSKIVGKIAIPEPTTTIPVSRFVRNTGSNKVAQTTIVTYKKVPSFVMLPIKSYQKIQQDLEHARDKANLEFTKQFRAKSKKISWKKFQKENFA